MTDRVQVCQLCGIRTTHVDPNGEPLCSEHGGTLHASSNSAAEQLARDFHETYEQLAPGFHYDTRRESSVPWDEVPEPNRSLMIAVAQYLIDAGRAIPNRVREAQDAANAVLAGADEIPNVLSDDHPAIWKSYREPDATPNRVAADDPELAIALDAFRRVWVQSAKDGKYVEANTRHIDGMKAALDAVDAFRSGAYQ